MHDKVIYPGTFDPITYGHLHIIERASQLFKQVIVAIAKNNSKTTVFNGQERLALAKTVLKTHQNIKPMLFDGLLVEFAKQQKVQLIVRALRSGSDFNHEYQLACHNKAQWAPLDTLFLIPEPQYAYIHASMVREIAQHQGQLSHLVPTAVAQAIVAKQVNDAWH